MNIELDQVVALDVSDDALEMAAGGLLLSIAYPVYPTFDAPSAC